MPLPWRVALRTRSAVAVYTLAGSFLSYVISHKLHVDVSSQALIQSVASVVGMGATFLALLGRQRAPVRDVKRLQQLVSGTQKSTTSEH